MVYTIDEIRRIVKPVAERYCLPAVYLFGSYARGTADEESDVDLLVDTTGTSLKSLVTLGTLYDDLEKALGKRTDQITVSSLREKPQIPREQTFRNTVWNEKVRIYDAA